MACPYFYPLERAPQSGKKLPPAPLGDVWSGACHADADEWRPDPQTARELCNFGYARGRCARLPGDGPDAVRFTISHDRRGLIGIYWVVEKDHLPHAHGPLQYSEAQAGFVNAHPDACIARQAEAYLSSYCDRKSGAGR